MSVTSIMCYKNLCTIFLTAQAELNRLEIFAALYSKARIENMRAIVKVAETTIIEQLCIDLHIDPNEVETSYIDLTRKIGHWLPLHVCSGKKPHKWLAISLDNGNVFDMRNTVVINEYRYIRK